MNKKILYALTGLSLLFLGCCSSGNNESAVRCKMKTFVKEFGSCDSISSNCVSVKISYPLFTKADDAFVKDSLQNQVDRMVLQPVFEIKNKSLDEMADSLIADYKRMKSEFPDSPIRYELERNINVVLNTGKIISIEFNEYSFLGGAHPNSIIVFCNIDLKTGKELVLSELLVKGYQEKLNIVGEKKFRETRQLKSEDNFEESGFWFKDNKFVMNENFLITENGLKFFFNDYEVAPHAVGPTELIIKYDEIRSIINPDGLLSSFGK